MIWLTVILFKIIQEISGFLHVVANFTDHKDEKYNFKNWTENLHWPYIERSYFCAALNEPFIMVHYDLRQTILLQLFKLGRESLMTLCLNLIMGSRFDCQTYFQQEVSSRKFNEIKNRVSEMIIRQWLSDNDYQTCSW